jgi:pimeloyl-ACP methyl ester carboxylesterase
MDTIQHSQEQYLQLDGSQLVFDTFGDPHNNPLLLIAGLGNQLIGWREEFCRQFAEKGLFVIRFDNRDAGLSSRFDKTRAPSLFALGSAFVWGTPLHAAYDLSDMAGDAAALLDHLGLESAHIFGASLGGMIAQSLAIDYPARVRSLTLLLTAAVGSRHPLPRPRSLILFSPPEKGTEAQIERYLKIKRALHGPRYPLDETELREHARRMADRSPVPAGTRRQLAAIANYGSKLKSLQELDVPTLVIHGTQDPLLPPGHARRLAGLIPGAKLVLLQGLGHELPSAAWPEIVAACSGHLQHAEDRITRE